MISVQKMCRSLELPKNRAKCTEMCFTHLLDCEYALALPAVWPTRSGLKNRDEAKTLKSCCCLTRLRTSPILSGYIIFSGLFNAQFFYQNMENTKN